MSSPHQFEDAVTLAERAQSSAAEYVDAVLSTVEAHLPDDQAPAARAHP